MKTIGRLMPSRSWTGIIAGLTLSLCAGSLQAQTATLTTLSKFTGSGSPNRSRSPLVDGNDGFFYGTSENGGFSGGNGSVFKVTPQGVVTTLASFSGSTGYNPQAGLIKGSDGNFWGTSYQGGPGGYGTVFKMTPAGALTTVVAFNGSNGALSDGGVDPGE